MSTQPGPQHIIALQAENVQRLTVVNIQIDPAKAAGTVVLSGENGAGKSSVLNAIEMALRGKDGKIDKPIRTGKEKATIILKTQDYIVKRRISGETTILEVTNHEGLMYRKPQDLLDRMMNDISFDPLGFAQMKPDDQAKRLLDICPSTLDLEQNAADQAAAKEERRDANANFKRLYAQLQGMAPTDPETPTTEVSVSTLGENLSKVMDSQRRLNTAVENVRAAELRISSIDQQMETLKAERQALSAKVAEANSKIKACPNYENEITNLRAQMKSAEATNAKVRLAKQRSETASALQDAQKQHQLLDDKVTSLTVARENAVKGIKFPVEGLAIDAAGRVVFNGNPLKQCSTAEQIKVGIALAATANPGLRVAFIRHGSLLDAKSMAFVSEVASKHGMQVWIERVDDKSPAAIQIADGSNIGATDSTPEAVEPPKVEA